MALTTLQARHILTERLGNALNLAPRDVEMFKYICTAVSYFKLPDHEGGYMMPGARHYRRGEEYTFNDVPWEAVLDSAESKIERTADLGERTRIFGDVMRGLPLCKSSPRWDRPPVNPNGKPTTPYSLYRKKKGSKAPSNEQMLKSFAEAAGLDEDELDFVGAQITWWDAMGDDERSPMLGRTSAIPKGRKNNRNSTLSSGDELHWAVAGGRLGRDHTFADVPSHYARDRLVHYTLTNLGSDKHDRVLAALCPDLNQSEIAAYGKRITGDQGDADKDEANEEHNSGNSGKSSANKRPSEGDEHSNMTKRVKI
ncbi:hypothetical protein F5Y08DRAFT_312039 [Xylaria arbuscula]|nr:hypothetical protein F5Y08DRAFT_312039 [Xylaria arbuscula]